MEERKPIIPHSSTNVCRLRHCRGHKVQTFLPLLLSVGYVTTRLIHVHDDTISIFTIEKSDIISLMTGLMSHHCLLLSQRPRILMLVNCLALMLLD